MGYLYVSVLPSCDTCRKLLKPLYSFNPSTNSPMIISINSIRCLERMLVTVTFFCHHNIIWYLYHFPFSYLGILISGITLSSGIFLFSCFLSKDSCFRPSSYFSCENLLNISVKKNSCLTSLKC